jgi:hypothetical protein
MKPLKGRPDYGTEIGQSRQDAGVCFGAIYDSFLEMLAPIVSELEKQPRGTRFSSVSRVEFNGPTMSNRDLRCQQ